MGCLRESDRFLCKTLISCHSDTLQDAIVIYPPEIQRRQTSFFAYKLKSKSWCQITLLNQSEDYVHSSRKSLVQVINHTTVVRLTGSSKEIQLYDLATKRMCKKSIEAAGSDDNGMGFDCLAASKKDLYCVKKVQVATKITTKSVKNRNTPSVSLRVPGSFVFSQTKHNIIVSYLYMFESIDDTAVSQKPLLTVCGSIESLCITGGVACMLIRQTKRLIIYALFECVISFVDLKEHDIGYNSYVCPTPSGGLNVITETDILQLDIRVKTNSISGTIVDAKFCAERIPYGWTAGPYGSRYEVVEDKIITVKRQRNESKFQYQRLPKKIGFLEEEEAFDIEFPESVRKAYDSHFMQVKLPKEAVICPVNCLHCKYQETSEIHTTYCERLCDEDEYDYSDSFDDLYDPSDIYDPSDFYDENDL